MIISFNEKPSFRNSCNVSNPKGFTKPFFLISPIINAQNLLVFNTLYDSFATDSIDFKKSLYSSRDKSPSILLLYFIISEYGGCVHMKSMLWSFIKSSFCASPILISTSLLPYAKLSLLILSSTDLGFISTPIISLFSNFASITEVPPPTN